MAETETPGGPAKSKRKRNWRLIIVLLIVALVLGWWAWFNLQRLPPTPIETARPKIEATSPTASAEKSPHLSCSEIGITNEQVEATLTELIPLFDNPLADPNEWEAMMTLAENELNCRPDL